MMNERQKELILVLRDQGLTYREIAERTHVTPENARNICVRYPQNASDEATVSEGTCIRCGKPIAQIPGTKSKKFCSDYCRRNFYNKKLVHKPHIRVCERCGNEFVAYGGYKKRFCCRECMNVTKEQKHDA